MKFLKRQKKTGFNNTFRDCLLSFWANCFSFGRATPKELCVGYFMWKMAPYLLLFFFEPKVILDEDKYVELNQVGQVFVDAWTNTYALATTSQRFVMFFEPIYFIAASIPAFSLIARRLHDNDKSAWFMALCLIPVFGWLYLLWLLLKKGQPTENRFGKPRI